MNKLFTIVRLVSLFGGQPNVSTVSSCRYILDLVCQTIRTRPGRICIPYLLTFANLNLLRLSWDELSKVVFRKDSYTIGKAPLRKYLTLIFQQGLLIFVTNWSDDVYLGPDDYYSVGCLDFFRLAGLVMHHKEFCLLILDLSLFCKNTL